MRLSTTLIAGIATAALLAGCDDATNGPQAGTAQLRLVHASPTLGAVDVLVGGAPVITGVTYGNSSTAATVPSGVQSLEVRAGGQVIGQLNGALSEAHINSVVVASGSAQLSATVTPDTGAASPTRANVRIVNVTSGNTDSPTLLDVLLTATNQPGQAPDSVQTFSIDTKTASYGPLMQLNPGHIVVKFVPDNGSAVLTQVEFDGVAGIKKAVVLERAADGSYQARVVNEP